jgi:ubiquinone/menaquinone biosynthesis C-methylase UbiE
MNTDHTKKVYNEDVQNTGRYIYTDKNLYSAVIATQKQTNEIHALIKSITTKQIKILDIGCGDGTYTLEMANVIKPQKIIGFDIANEAIKFARNNIPKTQINKIFFEVGNVYNLSKKYSKKEFDLAVFRGVLHHLDHPQKAIAEISQVSDKVIILEPNGFNPVLKLIEKFSAYHVRHGEKSYWPPVLDAWFCQNGYHVVTKKYFSIVPYFCPKILTIILKRMEPVFEKISFINRFYCGGLLVLYQKN